MCKITAIGAGMCLPKCFVIIVNLFTFLLGSLIFGACIVGLMYAKSTLGHGNLNFLFYGPIAFGGFIVFISFFGCCGACFKNRCMLMTFAILLLIIFACQVGVVYIVYDLYAKINKSVSEYLMDTLKSAKDESDDTNISLYIWELMQSFFECCGVNSLSDWQVARNESLPMSCCPTRNETEVTMEMSSNATCSQSDAYGIGCKGLVTDYLAITFHPVTVGVIIVLAIQLINLILSCCMFFVYGWTERKEHRRTYLATSPQAVHDQFIIRKDRF